jgi:hypothetical protein
MGSGNHLFDPNSNLQTAHHWQRRDFVKCVAALVGAAGLSTYDMRWAAADPPPETSHLRIIKAPAICLAPEYVAEELLRLEGFSNIEYVTVDQSADSDLLSANRADISAFAPPNLLRTLMKENPSSRWPECAAVATNCSPTSACAASGI